MCRFQLKVRWCPVFFALRPIHYHSRHHRAQPPRAAFKTYILHRRDRAAARAGCAGARHGARSNALVVLPPLRRVAAVMRHIALNAEDDAGLVVLRLHRQQHALVILLAQPARLEQRQGGAALFAGHGARPEIGHRWLGDPARVARVFEIGGIEFGVERIDLRNSLIINF